MRKIFALLLCWITIGCSSLVIKKEDNIPLKVTKFFYRFIILFPTFGISELWIDDSKYESAIASWMGADVNALISSWGAPSSVYEMPNGNKMYTWLYQGNAIVYNTYNPYLNNSVGFIGQQSCKTTFTTNTHGKIIHWQYEGNACR